MKHINWRLWIQDFGSHAGHIRMNAIDTCIKGLDTPIRSWSSSIESCRRSYVRIQEKIEEMKKEARETQSFMDRFNKVEPKIDTSVYESFRPIHINDASRYVHDINNAIQPIIDFCKTIMVEESIQPKTRRGRRYKAEDVCLAVIADVYGTVKTGIQETRECIRLESELLGVDVSYKHQELNKLWQTVKKFVRRLTSSHENQFFFTSYTDVHTEKLRLNTLSKLSKRSLYAPRSNRSSIDDYTIATRDQLAQENERSQEMI